MCTNEACFEKGIESEIFRACLFAFALVAALSALPILLTAKKEPHCRGFCVRPHSLDQPRSRPPEAQSELNRISVVERHVGEPNPYGALSDIAAAYEVAPAGRVADRRHRRRVPLVAENVGTLREDVHHLC